MSKRTLLGLAFALLTLPGMALGQGFPERAIKLVVPYPPGGPLDVVARLLTPRLAAQLGQPVIVDNKSGAAGAIGVDSVAKAAPDGYTMLFTVNATLTITTHTSKASPFDPLTDLTPIASVVDLVNILVVHGQVPANTVTELVAYAKKNPKKVTFSSGGVGAMNHLEGELLKNATAAPMLHVPYKGNAPAMTALISGEVSFMFNAIAAVKPHISSGKVRPLAVTSLTRNKMLPELPTMIEAGIPGFDVVLWYGFLGPARLPEAVTGRYLQALKAVMNEAALQESLRAQGFEINLMTSSEFATRLKDEYLLWGKVIRETNVEKN